MGVGVQQATAHGGSVAFSTRAWRAIRRLPYSVANLISPFVEPSYQSLEPPSPEESIDANSDGLLRDGSERDLPSPNPRPTFKGYSGSGHGKGRGPLQWYILFLCATIAIMTEFGEFLSAAPQTEVFLQIACNAHYASIGDNTWQDTSGDRCRIEPVQTELAIVDGWKETFDQLPGIVLAIPYGILADRVGRKPILLLGQFGVLMSEIFVRLISWYSNIFPLRFIWFASAWRLVGGGNQVHNAMVFTALADTHDEHARADAFYKLLAAILISEIVATPLSAGLMRSSAWIPMVLTPVILFATLLVCLFFLPETLQESLKSSKSSEIPSKTDTVPIPADRSMNLHTVLSSAGKAIGFLTGRRNVMYLLFCYFVATVGRKGMFLLLQFVYKKFGWSLAQASFLISLKGFVNLVLNLVILPLLTQLVMSPRFGIRINVARKDLVLSKLAAILLTLGCLTLALCGSVGTLVLGVCIFALGNSWFLTARSLVTGLVPPTNVGVLYTAIGMVSGVGVLIAGPLLAQTFSFGMRLGDAWLGLPYGVAAALFGMVVMAMWQVRLPRGASARPEDVDAVDPEEGLPMMERVDE